MASVLRICKPAWYCREVLKSNKRIDGRDTSECRRLIVNTDCIGTADSSALVKLGGTSVVCGIRMEVAPCKVGFPDEGFIVPNVELPALCSPRYKPGPPCEEAQILTQNLNDIILTSGIVSLQDLVIVNGKSAWVLYVDVVCLHNDGNVMDACLASVVAALSTVRLPAVVLQKNKDSEEMTDFVLNPDVRQPLSLHCFPLAVTFAVCERYLLMDPTLLECDVASSILTLVLDANGNISFVDQYGSEALSWDNIEACLRIVCGRYKEIASIVEKAVVNGCNKP